MWLLWLRGLAWLDWGPLALYSASPEENLLTEYYSKDVRGNFQGSQRNRETWA